MKEKNNKRNGNGIRSSEASGPSDGCKETACGVDSRSWSTPGLSRRLQSPLGISKEVPALGKIENDTLPKGRQVRLLRTQNEKHRVKIALITSTTWRKSIASSCSRSTEERRRQRHGRYIKVAVMVSTRTWDGRPNRGNSRRENMSSFLK